MKFKNTLPIYFLPALYAWTALRRTRPIAGFFSAMNLAHLQYKGK